MSAQFSAEEIIEITQGRLASGMMPDEIGPVATDTRALTEGQWYLALSGEKFDGHNFLGDAFSRGAIGCIVEERQGYAVGNKQFPLIAVGDTLAAYQQLANAWRRKVNPKVIGITGSSGKTTTKEMCAAVFSAAFKTHKSAANENNDVGAAKTLLTMPDDTEVLIVELAMRARWEISRLSKMTMPDIGMIVNVGLAHLGPVGSLEEIIYAKCELLEELDAEKAVAIIGQDSVDLIKRASSVFAGRKIVYAEGDIKEVSVTPQGTVFMAAPAKTEFFVEAHGLSHLQDAWCAVMAAREVGMDDATIAAGLREFHPLSGRGAKLKTKEGALVIDETYNGNPDSVRAAVTAFCDQRAYPLLKKYVVLGDLAELGDEAEELHMELGLWLKEKNITGLITVGDLGKCIADGAIGARYEVVACANLAEVAPYLVKHLDGESGVLIKASRSSGLDKLVSQLVPQVASAH